MYLHESEIYEMLRDFKYPDLLGGGPILFLPVSGASMWAAVFSVDRIETQAVELCG